MIKKCIRSILNSIIYSPFEILKIEIYLAIAYFAYFNTLLLSVVVKQ